MILFYFKAGGFMKNALWGDKWEDICNNGKAPLGASRNPKKTNYKQFYRHSFIHCDFHSIGAFHFICSYTQVQDTNTQNEPSFAHTTTTWFWVLGFCISCFLYVLCKIGWENGMKCCTVLLKILGDYFK